MRQRAQIERSGVGTGAAGEISNFMTFFLMFLLFGGLFSVLYTLGMVLVSGVTAAFVGGMDALWEMVSAYPWLQMLGGSWLLSGIPFAILMITILENEENHRETGGFCHIRGKNPPLHIC